MKTIPYHGPHDELSDDDLYPQFEGSIPDETAPGISSVVSSTECTGMMHVPPHNEDEFEAYQHLYSTQIAIDPSKY